MKTKEMPKVDWSKLSLSEYDQDIVRRFVKPDGSIRKSRPSLPKKVKVKDATYFGGYRYDYADEEGRRQGIAAYVWRHVAFLVSPIAAHHCMPCTDFCYLPGTREEGRQLENSLRVLIDAIVDSVPSSQWHGVTRWGQAFGQVGTPVLRENGSIVYR